MARVIKQTELGIEIQCTKCAEFFPADHEFFAVSRTGKYGCTGACKACLAEYTKQWRAKRKKR